MARRVKPRAKGASRVDGGWPTTVEDLYTRVPSGPRGISCSVHLIAWVPSWLVET